MAEKCSVCSKDGSKKCSKCKMQFYCSKECQSQDWQAHKKICREISKIATQQAVGPIRGMWMPDSMKNRSADMLSKMSGMVTTPLVPEYHKEYKKLYPAEQTNFEKLRDNWMMTKMLDEKLFGDRVIDEGREYGFRDLVKRWNYIGPELGEFLSSNPSPGDIFRKRIVGPHGSSTSAAGNVTSQTVYQTMRNTPVPPVEFHFGKTYVSVGFVDMFQLLVGSFDESDDTAIPLIFVGYDKSEVVVARSLLIYEMMQQGVSADSILQVWFSTGWNDKTLKDFHQTIQNLLKEKGTQIEDKVKMLIKHWGETKMTASTVLPLWKQFITERFIDPLDNLRYEKDRADYARYIFTGHIFGKNDKDYVHGNVTMFSLPKELDYYIRQDESFFAAIALSSLNYKTTLLKSITDKIRESLTNLTAYIKNNRLVCNFLLRDIDLKDRNTLEDMRQLNATMIDWSNIPDYLPVDDFFEMAKSCDGTDTKHFFHYINWQGRVFGASLIDYSNRSQIYKVLKTQMAEKYDKVKKDRPFLRQDQYLIYYLNAADQMLAIKYRQRYIDYVMAGRHVVVGEPTSDEFNPFQRSNTCFFISFSFKK